MNGPNLTAAPAFRDVAAAAGRRAACDALVPRTDNISKQIITVERGIACTRSSITRNRPSLAAVMQLFAREDCRLLIFTLEPREKPSASDICQRQPQLTAFGFTDFMRLFFY